MTVLGANEPAKRPNPYENALMMRALRREPVERVPVWLMRQAGRYMAEYRAVREKISFLELCRSPKLCAEVMQTAVEKLGVDAAIIFSDLLPILEPMGFGLEFSAGDGPIIHRPFLGKEDLNRVGELEDLAPLDFVFETVTQTRRLIDVDKPVIGFAGAPFTLASYAIEGGASRNFLRTKTLMFREESVWNELLGRFARSIARYLLAQIRAGAQLVQIFDSWIGCLGVEDYQRYVLPHMKNVLKMIRDQSDAPILYFGTGNPSLLPLFAQTGCHGVGVDWRIPLPQAWAMIGKDCVIQGNLDPAVLLASPEKIRSEVRRLLNQVRHRPGFIFNLGHGILRETPVEHVIALVQAVHEFSECSEDSRFKKE